MINFKIFTLFPEMFQGYLDLNDRLGLVVADEEQERSDDIILDFKKYKRQGTGFCTYKSVDLTRIIDNIHFVKSHDSWPLQLTDVVLYHYHRELKVMNILELNRNC